MIEAPRRGDATFYGGWLLAAGEAGRLFQEALDADRIFAEQVNLLGRRIELGICATIMVGSLLDKGSHSITFPLDSVEAEIVSIMIGMGFFAVTGKRVQIVIPPTVNVQTVKDGILQVVRTLDDVGLLHVDQLMPTMPRRDADDWQRRLAAMDQHHRIADRDVMLASPPQDNHPAGSPPAPDRRKRFRVIEGGKD